ncbi:helicase associated domain-containing protein [Acanthopleuribacter pedis]|uniref:Helicase associated domain-containing protein n=1 Tax=Acanthopleuribacter pedis TaxID=442870 RepID=A0A8J7QEM3_9BACT|nr:helicase associated domain-containing protein [Acanthopleuribacter pedis]MBO1318320.1 helicase associated domain-containing protein [Acanthopleuribacter pedis]
MTLFSIIEKLLALSNEDRPCHESEINKKLPWDAWIDLLEKFKIENGHLCVPQRYVSGGAKLGIWVSQQRSKKQAGKLSEQEIARLEAFPGWKRKVLKSQSSRNK